jgi:hypothetical protein
MDLVASIKGSGNGYVLLVCFCFSNCYHNCFIATDSPLLSQVTYHSGGGFSKSQLVVLKGIERGARCIRSEVQSQLDEQVL